MLSRTAENLYWMARYVERAENLARLLEVGYRMARLPDWEKGGYRNEWRSTLAAAGCEAGFLERHDEITAEAVIDYIAFDQKNSSSIYSCLRTARNNARGVRTALTSDMWENLNALWAGCGAADERPGGAVFWPAVSRNVDRHRLSQPPSWLLCWGLGRRADL